MPKYAIHVIVLEEAIRKLKQSKNASEKQIGNLIDSNKQSAILGSIGPDLFFWSPDYEIVKKPLEFYKNFRFLFELYDKTIGLAKDTIEALGEPVDKAVSTLSGVDVIKKLINEIKETASIFKSTLATGLFVGVFEGYDFLANMGNLPSLSHQLFDWFTPPLQGDIKCPVWRDLQVPGTGCPAEIEKKWYWFDMLHYRYTGKFAQNLVNLSNSDEQKAYAFGYLTHIATDTVGHPFVNQIVGGPWRLHPQRHATVENFMDTWKYYKQYNESVNSTLHKRLMLPTSKKLYKMDYKLSNNLTNLLYSSFINTYSNLPSGKRPNNVNKDKGDKAGFLTTEDIKETYKVFCFIMEVLGKSYVKKPEEPFSGILDILNKLLDKFEPPPSPPTVSGMCGIWDILSFGLTKDSQDCYENFVKNIYSYLKYLAELLKWAFDTLNNLLDLIISALLSLPITVLMAILYGIQMLLYTIYRQMRWVLALNGFVYPEPDEVLGSSFGRNLITTFQCKIYGLGGVSGIEVFEKQQYPRIHSHAINSLQCPNNPPEYPITACAWYPRDIKSTPNKFIHDDLFDENILKKYAEANNPVKTRSLEESKLKIGNAIDFSVWAQKNAQNKSKKDLVYCDWNLDSDRGYGYKCWSADNLPTTNVKGEKYL